MKLTRPIWRTIVFSLAVAGLALPIAKAFEPVLTTYEVTEEERANGSRMAEVAEAGRSLSCYGLGIRTNSMADCQYYVANYTSYPLANWMPSGECRGCNP